MTPRAVESWWPVIFNPASAVAIVLWAVWAGASRNPNVESGLFGSAIAFSILGWGMPLLLTFVMWIVTKP